MDISSDTTEARGSRKVWRVQLRISARGHVIAFEIGARKAAEAVFGYVTLCTSEVWITSQHPKSLIVGVSQFMKYGDSSAELTYGLESSNVASKILGKVVNCHAALASIKETVWNLLDAFVGAVAGAEVEVCCPVVRASKGQYFDSI
jgi:hypothetical protein